MRRAIGGGVIVAFILVVTISFQLAQPATPTYDRERTFQAWSEALNKRAAYEAELARKQRVNQAWTERLEALAAHEASRRGMSERARQAWTDRLNGLAERLGAND